MEVLHSSLVTCLQFRIAMLTVSYRYDVTSFARSSDMCIAIDYNLLDTIFFLSKSNPQHEQGYKYTRKDGAQPPPYPHPPSVKYYIIV